LPETVQGSRFRDEVFPTVGWGVKKKTGKRRERAGIEGSGHDDELEVRALPHHLLDQPEQHVCRHLRGAFRITTKLD